MYGHADGRVCRQNGPTGAPRVGGPVGSPQMVGALFRAPGGVPGFEDGQGLGAGWPEGATAGVRGAMPWGGAGGVGPDLNAAAPSSSWPGGFAGQWGGAGAQVPADGDMDSRMMELTLVLSCCKICTCLLQKHDAGSARMSTNCAVGAEMYTCPSLSTSRPAATSRSRACRENVPTSNRLCTCSFRESAVSRCLLSVLRASLFETGRRPAKPCFRRRLGKSESWV
jgi:hypothetical protein